MTRRQFIAAVTLSLVAAPLVAEAQQPGKVYRLGILTPGLCSATSAPTTASVLPLILREMGYVEGQNLTIEQRCAEGKLDRLPGLARELVQLRVDTLLARSCGMRLAPGAAPSESGRSRQGDGGQGRGDRHRRVPKVAYAPRVLRPPRPSDP